jgi:neurofibromin 1
MSTKLSEAFAGEPNIAQRKAVESPASIDMVCNILNFLNASPMTLFEGPPDDEAEHSHFLLENFTSIVSCVLAANESVRRLATGVAQGLIGEEVVLDTLRASKSLDSATFKSNFWRLRYVPG